MTESVASRSRRIERFMRLPRRTGDTWQCAVVGMPLFVEAADTEEPVRQFAIACANVTTDDIAVETMGRDEATDRGRVLDTFLGLGLRSRKQREGRPARLEVRDESLGAFIKDALNDPELDVVLSDSLPRIDRLIEEIVRSDSDGPVPPGALEAEGVTTERMRLFADAARRFYERAPWDDVGHEDLVVIESPAAPDGMGCFAVIDEAGDWGLEFYASRDQFELANAEDEREFDQEEEPDDVESDRDDLDDDEVADPGIDFRWAVDFGRIDDLPAFDVGLWADSDLPVAGPVAYPVAIRPTGFRQFERPDASRLAFLEGVLRALAETTEAEVDSGRWTRTVGTADGQASFRFSIPSLLDEPRPGEPGREANERSMAALARFVAEGAYDDLDEAIEALGRSGPKDLSYPEPPTPADLARERVYRASGAPGRRRKQLLREAIATSPDCFEAYIQLGEITSEPAQALRLFEEGRAAAERVIGASRLDAMKGRFWEDPQTRTYLRGRFGIASTLRRLGRVDDAVGEYRAILSLDAQDHASAGHQLLAVLLEERRDGDVWDLLNRFDDDGPEWAYGWTLWAFRQRSRPEARDFLRIALDVSPRTAQILASAEFEPDAGWDLAESSDDDDARERMEEAFDCAMLVARAWRETPGAVEWLASELERRRAGRGPRRGGRHPVH